MANTASQSIAFYAGGKAMTGTYTESIRSNVLRTQMEGGIEKTAKRFGKAQITHNITYLYDASEYAAFKTWFKDTAKYGALFFNWTNPITDDIVDARISDGTYQVAPVNARGNYFYVQLNIETYE